MKEWEALSSRRVGDISEGRRLCLRQKGVEPSKKQLGIVPAAGIPLGPSGAPYIDALSATTLT